MALDAVPFSEVRFPSAKRPRSFTQTQGLEAGRPGKGSAPKVFWRVRGRLLREKNLISSFHPDAFLLGSRSYGEEEWGDFVSKLAVTFSGVSLNKFFCLCIF